MLTLTLEAPAFNAFAVPQNQPLFDATVRPGWADARPQTLPEVTGDSLQERERVTGGIALVALIDQTNLAARENAYYRNAVTWLQTGKLGSQKPRLIAVPPHTPQTPRGATQPLTYLDYSGERIAAPSPRGVAHVAASTPTAAETPTVRTTATEASVTDDTDQSREQLWASWAASDQAAETAHQGRMAKIRKVLYGLGAASIAAGVTLVAEGANWTHFFHR